MCRIVRWLATGRVVFGVSGLFRHVAMSFDTIRAPRDGPKLGQARIGGRHDDVTLRLRFGDSLRPPCPCRHVIRQSRKHGATRRNAGRIGRPRAGIRPDRGRLGRSCLCRFIGGRRPGRLVVPVTHKGGASMSIACPSRRQHNSNGKGSFCRVKLSPVFGTKLKLCATSYYSPIISNACKLPETPAGGRLKSRY